MVRTMSARWAFTGLCVDEGLGVSRPETFARMLRCILPELPPRPFRMPLCQTEADVVEGTHEYSGQPRLWAFRVTFIGDVWPVAIRGMG